MFLWLSTCRTTQAGSSHLLAQGLYLHCTHSKLTAPVRPSVAPRAFGLAALPHPLYGALDGDKPWYLPSHKAKRAPAASSSVGRSQPTPTINEAFCFLKDK